MFPRARVVLSASAVALAFPAAAAARPSGYQFDQFRLAGPARLVVEVTAPKQVPGLPASARGYHQVCAASVSPILRYRIKYSLSGDTGSFGLRAQWARPGSTAYATFGVANPYPVEGSTYGAPVTRDHPITGFDFTAGAGGEIGTAPPVALLDLRLIVRTSYFVPLYGDVGYAFDVDQATLNTKLDFRVSTSTSCPAPPLSTGYFKAR